MEGSGGLEQETEGEWRQGKNLEGSGEWEQETEGMEIEEGLVREWRMGARDRRRIGKGVENGSERQGEWIQEKDWEGSG